jgi:negative regulator of flagellin synthesis FlgM
MIDKLGGINPLNSIQNTQRAKQTQSAKSDSDSISVSAEAKKMAEAYYLKEVADETPDIRTDLVNQIKEKIKDPSYLNPERIASAADGIMASYGL